MQFWFWNDLFSADIQQVYRNEGKYPNRGPGFDYIKFFRSRRPDLFSQTTGLLTEEGEDWQKIRSQVQQGNFQLGRISNSTHNKWEFDLYNVEFEV